MISERILPALAAALVGAAGGSALTAWGYSAKLHALDMKHQAAVAQLYAEQELVRTAYEQRERATEARWNEATRKASDEAQARIDQAQRDAVAAAAAADSLRKQAAALARTDRAACKGAAPAPGGQAASTAADVLADLFARADARAGELAAYADRSAAAGAACERAHDAVSGAK